MINSTHPRAIGTVGQFFSLRALCWGCGRTFCYTSNEHLFCTLECFEEYSEKESLDRTNPEQLQAHFVGVRA